MTGRRTATLLAALLLLTACGGTDGPEPITFAEPETALDYEVEMTGAPSDEIEALLRQSLDVFRRQDEGAQSLAFLRRRVSNDEETAQRILRSFGYFDGGLSYTVAQVETPPDEPPRARSCSAVTTSFWWMSATGRRNCRRPRRWARRLANRPWRSRSSMRRCTPSRGF